MLQLCAEPDPAIPAAFIRPSDEPVSTTAPIDETEAVYRLLMRGSDPDAADPFDVHITACIVTLAFWESIWEQRPLSETTGLDGADLAVVTDQFFPHATYLFQQHHGTTVQRGADEECLLDLLMQCTTERTPFQARLAAMIARRAQRPDHLWQDLGLRNRRELSRLMMRHFRVLGARNTSDMKWKKFLYRMICRDAGYALCTAPSCSECADFEACFGDESGESRLARARRSDDLGAIGVASVRPG